MFAVDDIRIWSGARTGVEIQAQLFTRWGAGTLNLLSAFYLDMLAADNVTLANAMSSTAVARLSCSSNACFIPLTGIKVLCGDGVRAGQEVGPCCRRILHLPRCWSFCLLWLLT